jgi:hypothetical protein
MSLLGIPFLSMSVAESYLLQDLRIHNSQQSAVQVGETLGKKWFGSELGAGPAAAGLSF